MFTPVPDGIAAVTVTILLSFSACFVKVSPKTEVYDGIFDFDLDCSPVSTLNLVTP